MPDALSFSSEQQLRRKLEHLVQVAKQKNQFAYLEQELGVLQVAVERAIESTLPHEISRVEDYLDAIQRVVTGLPVKTVHDPGRIVRGGGARPT